MPSVNSAQGKQSFQKKRQAFKQDSDVDQEVIITPPQAPTSVYVPYLEGPKIN